LLICFQIIVIDQGRRFITTPLLLLDLLLTAAMPWPTLLWVILIDWVMILCGLVGALVQSTYKWGYYTFGKSALHSHQHQLLTLESGCVALFYIVYQLGWEARIHASKLGPDVNRTFLSCGTLTLLIWMLYPIAWGVCEGGNVISPDSEAVFYGILDLIAKPVFGAMLLFGHRTIDPAMLGLRIRDYDEDPAVRGGASGEKVRAPGADGTHTNVTNAAAAAPAATEPAATV
jgi:bacteriorhodopsin